MQLATVALWEFIGPIAFEDSTQRNRPKGREGHISTVATETIYAVAVVAARDDKCNRSSSTHSDRHFPRRQCSDGVATASEKALLQWTPLNRLSALTSPFSAYCVRHSYKKRQERGVVVRVSDGGSGGPRIKSG